MRPFLDQAIQLGPGRLTSFRLSTRTTFAGSLALCALATLQTLKSPSCVWEASISDFCRGVEACHCSVTIGDGILEVMRL